ARTLRFYLFGLVFASIDWPLNFAYYARNDSRTPAAVGILSVFVYLGVALPLLPRLSFLGLALADGAKHAGHAAMTIFLIYRWGGRLGQGVLRTAGQTLIAAGVMAVGVWALAQWLLALLGVAGLGPRLAVVLGPAGAGAAIYYLLLRLLRLPEAALVDRAIARIAARRRAG
ncbi:MAG: polysaccharide biosynthesis C-terminal domain-containing protein, partial [Caldilineales bacterium]|nr:polysaccharide biosynthesis C-terminal domain-containing protein [Caldilineales bacterium]